MVNSTRILIMNKYDHTKIEKKWQGEWEKKKSFSPNLNKAKKPFYNLMMFPYPSAEGMHVGNMYAFTGADVYGRYQRMNGYDVLEPIGLDGFGIHSENYAIKVGRHPKEHAKISEENFYRQLHMIGNSYDWNRALETYDLEYYKWTQWLFVKMFKAGFAYKDDAIVNWCPSCKTVLADEQVIDDECERCGTEVTKREMRSWFFRITKYADRLLENIEKIKWPEKIKIAQRNWIGRSEGRIIKFENIEVFTTRPETVNSATFIAISGNKNRFTGNYVINPSTNKKIPVWEAQYVLANYGTGAIMGVPAYDEKDMEFAKKYKIDIVKKPFTKEIQGKKHTNYHLRDWLISRQRYWGPPIPMINCKDCGWQPVPERDLPVILPDIKDFKPQGDGVSPLYNASDSWKRVNCPKCGKIAERELDVSDTFLDSSWYFLAYPNLGTKEWEGYESPLNFKITKKWLPVNAYIGGAEHAVLHLLYARFVTMFLKDESYLDFEEPFPFLFGHGLIIKDGAKMSKSKGNVVNPDEYINKFGADTLRMYLMFLGPYNQGGDFRDSGIEGMGRFLGRVWRLFTTKSTLEEFIRPPSEEDFAPEVDVVRSKLHQTIKKVTEDITQMKFNTAISALMELVNVFYEYRVSSREYLKPLALLLAPFAPHMAEELWVGVLGEHFSVHKASWPRHDANLVKVEQLVIVIQVNGKVRSTLQVESGVSNLESRVIKLAKEDKKVSKWLDGRVVKKTVFVPGKLVNFVV